MYNFAGKYLGNEKKGPSDIDLATFWKTLEETCFNNQESAKFESKCEGIVGTPTSSQINCSQGILTPKYA
jgi:hypothetical protein